MDKKTLQSKIDAKTLELQELIKSEQAEVDKIGEQVDKIRDEHNKRIQLGRQKVHNMDGAITELKALLAEMEGK